MVQNNVVTVDPNGGTGRAWILSSREQEATWSVELPTFHINGDPVVARVTAFVATDPPRLLQNGVTSYRFVGQIADGFSLEVEYRLSPNSPVVRFRYRLRSDTPCRLTKPGGVDDLAYLSVSFDVAARVQEIQLSQFNALFHSFCLAENEITNRDFANGVACMGPLLVGSSDTHSFLVAYEHGSQYPDAFLQFHLSENRAASLRAVKGNYPDGQVVDANQPFETVWFQAGLVAGDAEEMARAYRAFVLNDVSENRASRQPFLFYNTWNYQERIHASQKRPYLADMNEARMLAEIDVAYQMGLDVFVIDTGWYEKTGDWHVSRPRFPRGLGPIKAKLDGYGMKLGLWFNPTVAAVSSEMHQQYSDCLMTANGKPRDPHEIWETEASQGLCLVSRYGEAFADKLIALHRELGVTYFKWDAIGQYGCDAPGHYHGTEENTTEERRRSYAFQLGAAMVRVVDKVCRACPDAIVDFDITEGGRTVGLQFLSAGKYFLINNGPYNHDYNMPVPADGNVNLFFYPGPARAWICRAPLTYDKWIPSVLFLTHYLPDDTHQAIWGEGREITAENQWIAVASLVLGQNGIWGDLLSLSPEGIARFSLALGLYKQIRDDVTAAFPCCTGQVGGSPEVHEKIADTGRGVVSLFATTPGTYTYVTQNSTAQTVWHNHGVVVAWGEGGRACITATFQSGEHAKVIFFGVNAAPPQ